jgi:hypothetical protein
VEQFDKLAHRFLGVPTEPARIVDLAVKGLSFA